MIGIYKITNKINGNSYIGQSNNINRRFIEHRCKETNKSLKLAFIKYGIKNFSFEVLEQCSLEKLNEKEIYYISKLKPQYNRSSGGQGSSNHTVSLELRKKLSEISKKNWSLYSKEKKEKLLKNLCGPRKGHLVSEETRNKLRIANLGKKQSQETIERRKNTIKLSGYIRTNEKHKKRIKCIETGEIFNSIKEAQLKYGLSSLCSHLKKRNKTCKGKHYIYCSVETTGDECNRVG